MENREYVGKRQKIKMNNKGMLGLDMAKSFLLALFTMAVVGFALIIALNSLNDSSAGTDDTALILGNVSDGAVDLFANAGTWFSLIAVVVIIMIIAVVIVSVNRFGGEAR
jgi:hypothetical protein